MGLHTDTTRTPTPPRLRARTQGLRLEERLHHVQQCAYECCCSDDTTDECIASMVQGGTSLLQQLAHVGDGTARALCIDTVSEMLESLGDLLHQEQLHNQELRARCVSLCQQMDLQGQQAQRTQQAQQQHIATLQAQLAGAACGPQPQAQQAQQQAQHTQQQRISALQGQLSAAHADCCQLQREMRQERGRTAAALGVAAALRRELAASKAELAARRVAQCSVLPSYAGYRAWDASNSNNNSGSHSDCGSSSSQAHYSCQPGGVVDGRVVGTGTPAGPSSPPMRPAPLQLQLASELSASEQEDTPAMYISAVSSCCCGLSEPLPLPIMAAAPGSGAGAAASTAGAPVPKEGLLWGAGGAAGAHHDDGDEDVRREWDQKATNATPLLSKTLSSSVQPAAAAAFTHPCPGGRGVAGGGWPG